MKIPTTIFTVLSILGSLVLQAQDPKITAPITQGCDSLTVNLHYDTSLSFVTSALWDFGDGTTSTDPSFDHTKKYNKLGAYTVSLTLNGTLSTTIPNFITIGKTINKDTINLQIAYRDTTGLGANAYVIEALYNNNHPYPFTYQWSIDGVYADNKKSFVHTLDSASLYNVSLVLTDQMGCSSTFTETINVQGSIEIPNVFSPNDDGKYDVFIINPIGNNVLSFKVFTRTGLLIYKTEANTIAWDGRLPSGDKVFPGIYYYIVEALNASPPIQKSGFFYIYR